MKPIHQDNFILTRSETAVAGRVTKLTVLTALWTAATLLAAPVVRAATLACHPSEASIRENREANVELTLMQRDDGFFYELIDLDPPQDVGEGEIAIPERRGLAKAERRPWGLLLKHGEFELKLPYAHPNAAQRPIAQLSFLQGKTIRFAHLNCATSGERPEGNNLIALPDWR